MQEVSRNPEIYSSAIGNTNLWDLEADALVARRSLIDTDSPEHTQLRRIVSQAFTPRNVKLWEPLIRTTIERLIDRFIRQDGGDWVKLVAGYRLAESWEPWRVSTLPCTGIIHGSRRQNLKSYAT